VVETMFFTSVVGDDEVPEVGGAAALATKVDFEGSPTGSFRLRLHEPAARAMAGLFLSVDDAELSEEQIRGVMGELTNMVAGAALSRLDPEAKFRLESPEPLTETQAPEGTRTASCALPLECGWMHVDLWLQ